jgi:predicted HAD superfamily hydrolase
LKKHKLTGIFDELYLSSAHGLLKSAGTMFTYVQEEEKIHLKKWYHTGDNMESDYKIPIKAGIRAGLFTGAYLTRYEKNFAPRPGSTHSRTTFAALLRQCRLACPYKSEKEKIIWDTTLNVSAPLLISYVQWCLARAGALGAGRVYFLARDGQILYKLARIMNRFSPTPLELHYLYVSRQALLFPAMEDLDEESLGWILAPTAILTPRIILKRVNIEPEEIESALREHGFKNPDERLSKKNLPAFKSLILDSSVKVLLKKRIAQYREKASGYLQQEGLAKDDRFVLVDIGWNGTLQRSISRLLAKQGKNHPVKGLYFGLHRELKHKPADRLEAFFFSPGKPHGLEQESYIVPIIEMFTAADHGGTVKYEFRDNKYEPVLRNSKNTTGIRWGVKIQQEAMVYLAEAMAAAPAGELRQGIEQNLRLFIKNPTLREAEVYGSYLDAEDQNESYYFPLARKFNLIELFRHYKYGYVHHHNEWREGARKLSSPHMRGGNHKKNAI